MKYYQEHEQSCMIYRTDGITVECTRRDNIDFFESAYTVEIFELSVAYGILKECDPVYPKKKLSRDFWHNAVLITILLILSMGFIFL